MDTTINFTYSFIPMGSLVSSHTKFKPRLNRFFIDVGNSTEKGIIDHHMFTNKDYSIDSSSELLINNPESIFENLDATSNHIEIICHQSPDFDCFATVYLLQNLLCHGDFPLNYRTLVEYVNLIDSGSLNISKSHIYSPYAVSCVLDDIVRSHPTINSSEDYNQILMQKGLLLIEKTMENLARRNIARPQVSHIHNNTIIRDQDDFLEAFKLLDSDYNKYLKDKDTICFADKILLPDIDNNQVEFKEIDGLFWRQIPSCKLNKHWARTDESSPSGSGYVFTFIPKECKMATLPDGSDVLTNRVIISVTPGKGVCLEGLAQVLENAELDKEEELIISRGLNINDWRTRSYVRFKNEAWCTNADPWYDGRNFGSTIVDSPGNRLSLLSIEEILELTKNFTVPQLNQSLSRYVLPFSFDYQEYYKLHKKLNKLFDRFIEKKDDNCFLSYINEYLFDTGNDSPCAYYRLSDDQLANFITELQKGSAIYSAEYRYQIKSGDVCIFKYGMGVLIFDFELLPPVNIDNVLNLNERVCSDKDNFINIFKKVFDINRLQSLASSDGLIYGFASMRPNLIHYKRLKESTLKLSNNLLWNHPYSFSHLEQRLVLELTPFSHYSFSKNGGSFIAYDIETNSKQFEDLKHKFFNGDFYIFLLALHQRYCLLSMASQLSRHTNEVAGPKRVRKLRENFLEFVTRSWFSQITTDELGTEKYKRWQDVFDNNALYDEIHDQLSSYDNFNMTNLTRDMEIVSAVFFPLMLFGVLFSAVQDFHELAADSQFAGLLNLLQQACFVPVLLGIFALMWVMWLLWINNFNPFLMTIRYLKKLLNVCRTIIDKEPVASNNVDGDSFNT